MRGTAKAWHIPAKHSPAKAKPSDAKIGKGSAWCGYASLRSAMDMLCTDAHREAKAQYCYTL